MAPQQEYIGIDELAVKLGIAENASRFETFRQKVYRRMIPGQVKILGRWSFRIIEIEKALLRGEL
jgi:hypothetical protein